MKTILILLFGLFYFEYSSIGQRIISDTLKTDNIKSKSNSKKVNIKDTLVFPDGSKMISSGGSVSSGPFLKASGNSLVPYANYSEAPKGAFYYMSGLAIDTSFYVSDYSDQNESPSAISGYSNNNIGVLGLSTLGIGVKGEGNIGIYGNSDSIGIIGSNDQSNGIGIYGYSSIGTGGVFTSIWGYALETNIGSTTNKKGLAIFHTGVTGDSMVIKTDATIRQYNSGVEKIKTDVNGYIHQSQPVYSASFMDSSITINLNTSYIQVTNVGKNLWIASRNVGFTDNADTIIASKAGYYNIMGSTNSTSASTVTFTYRILAKTGSVTRVLHKTSNAGLGTGDVTRQVSAFAVYLNANDKVWAEVKASTTQSITFYNGQFTIQTVSLDL